MPPLSANSLPSDRGRYLGIYVHVPWCIQKCRYCDFYSVELNADGARQIPDETIESYLQTLMAEFFYRLRRQGQFRQFEALQTIFFGGGTPSLLPVSAIARLLNLFRQEFSLTADCEITLEGNPENLKPEYLAALRDCGVTRVSAGIQTFRQELLERMGRFFDPESYAVLLENLTSAGFASYSVDLIYGFPQQRKEDFLGDLGQLLSIDLPHLSLYSLTAEQGTSYGIAVQQHRESPPDEDLQEHLFHQLPGIMKEAGLQQYEVSSYALQGHYCRHNLRYWLYEACLSLGPGGHGFDGQRRYANPRSIFRWQRNPAGAPCEEQAPQMDVPLSLLRLCLPMPLSLWQDVLLRQCRLEPIYYERALSCLERWVEEGLGEWIIGGEKSFMWKKMGLQNLDDRIFEMCCLLEKGQSDLPVDFI